jgi:hypothetical protein
VRLISVLVTVAVAACGGIAPRFPQDVQTTLAHDDMRKLETERFIIYYPSARRPEVDRFLSRIDRCAAILRDHSLVHGADRKFVILMPDSPFNNAFVAPDALGYEAVSVIPAHSTLDFTTLFGLPPDPGLIGCHELVHYVHVQQTSGFWATWNSLFGHLYTPQLGYDPWFFEGLATHYEARLTGVGRPVWPIFTGMFAAAYAGKSIGSGDMSAFGRFAPTGHHYLVGSMFFRFLAERYGERPLWQAIRSQSSAFTGWFFTGTFDDAFGVDFGELLDQFGRWKNTTFPARPVPPGQQRLAEIGNDARYARGRDGTEAWVYEDVDLPPRIRIRDPRGVTLLDTNLVEIVPPRTLIQAAPLLVSGLSITADGSEVWLTALDQGAVFQTPRLLRWRRSDGKLREVVDTLGPGATISPDGKTYYYCYVDGDRWSLAKWDVASRKAQILVDMTPGSYVLGAQVSADGARLAANIWDGRAFAIYVVDASTGQIQQRITGDNGSPVYDASFTADGRVLYLGVRDARFQVFVDGQPISDAPYAALAPREANGTIRFLDRQDWSWHLAEIPLPATTPVETPPAAASAGAIGLAPAASPAGPPVAVQWDEPYSAFDHFFYPQVRSPSLAVGGGVPHLGLALSGGDRFDLHRWSIAGYVQPKVGDVGQGAHYGAYGAYYNQMAAPVQFFVEGGFLDWAAPYDTGDPDNPATEERRTRDASVGLAYTWRQSLSAALSGIYTSDGFAIDNGPLDRVWVGGPALELSWLSGEYTRYTGARRAIFATAETAYYPQRLSSFMSNITDVGGTLGVTVPLPVGRRHTITAFVRGRALVSRDDTGLLQLGGESALGVLWDRSSVMDMPPPPPFDDSRFPPNLRFIEPLRGYEDYAITTDKVTLGELSWKYPIIIDEGRASLWFLPAAFLRQLDLELFGAGAIDAAQDKHYAIGGATTLHLQFFRIPLAVTYQVARRLVDDKAFTQLVGIGPDL